MRGSPSHRLGFSCFSVLFCWFVFDFCLESWNVLGKLFLRKFISNPSTLFRAPAYLTPPASPCSSTVTTFFPSFQCPGEAGASRPRSVKSKSSGPPVKMASQAANPATLGKKRRESIFLCNGHPRRSLLWGVLLLAIREEPRATSLSSSKHLSLGAFFFSFFPREPKQIHFLGIKAQVWSFPTLGIWFLCIPSSAFNKCQHYPMGPTWISLRQLQVAPSDECGEVNEVTGHILLRNALQLTGALLHAPVSQLHLTPRAIYSWCMRLHTVINRAH